jgi:hypothetical protein
MSSATPIADMVRRMLEKGVAHEAIIMAIEGAELARVSADVHRTKPDTNADTAADRRRAYDRERKRNVRGSPLASTGHPRMSANSPLSQEEREEKKESKRGTRLPDKWTPPVADWVLARDLIGDTRTRAELAKFTDHWKQQPGQRGVKLDWSATWRNWIRRAAEYGNGKTSPNRPGSLVGSIQRELADLEREDETDPPVYPGHIQRLPS